MNRINIQMFCLYFPHFIWTHQFKNRDLDQRTKKLHGSGSFTYAECGEKQGRIISLYPCVRQGKMWISCEKFTQTHTVVIKCIKIIFVRILMIITLRKIVFFMSAWHINFGINREAMVLKLVYCLSHKKTNKKIEQYPYENLNKTF